MLNDALVHEFQRVYDNQMSGALRVVRSDDSIVRFYFEDGNLRLLDFGEPKELLLLSQFRRYHKIGAEIQAMVSQLYDAQDISVSGYLQQQQLVSEEEVGQVTRTLVEDVLCDCFGEMHQSLNFIDEVDIDDFDLDERAVKLRIDVMVLIEMVRVRVAERDAVQQEIESYDQPYVLVEGAPDQDSLNEQELHVLHFVDGRQTVNTIAQALRDSALNTACYLTSLSQQGFVRPRPAGTTTSIRERVIPQQPSSARSSTTVNLSSIAAPEGLEGVPPGGSGGYQVPGVGDLPGEESGAHQPGAGSSAQQSTVPVDLQQQAAAPIATPTRRRNIVEEPRSRFPTFVLLVVLVLAVGLFFLVQNAQSRQQEIDDARVNMRSAVESQDWTRANTLAEDALTKAGNDEIIKGKINGLIDELNQQKFSPRLDRLATLLDERDLALAQRELEGLPMTREVGVLWREDQIDQLRQLRIKTSNLAEEFRTIEASLTRSVQQQLRADNIERAFALIDAQPEMVRSPSLGLISEWRVVKFDEANDSRRGIDKQRARLNYCVHLDRMRLRQQILSA